MTNSDPVAEFARVSVMQRLGMSHPLIASLTLVAALPACSFTNSLDDVLCPKGDEDCGSASASGGSNMGGSGSSPAATGGGPGAGGSGGGTGGAPGQGGAPPSLDCPNPGDLELLYQNGQYQEPDSLSTRIRPHFQIKNVSDEEVAWSALSIRYYFTADGAEGLGYDCIYGFGENGCRGAVGGTIKSSEGPSMPSVLEVTFGEAAGTLLPLGTGASFKGAILHATGTDFDQENDYSYSDDLRYERDYAVWENVTLYCDDVLIAGTPPSD